MAVFRCTDVDGKQVSVQGEPGQNLMVLMRAAGLSVTGNCDGGASCGTCHVYISPPWADRVNPVTDEEDFKFDTLNEWTEESRLGCQIIWSDAYDGLSLTIAPK